LRRNRDGKVEIPGDAVKGAIRLSAERLLRWYVPSLSGEETDEEAPLCHSALRRIFASETGKNGPVRYRFQPAVTNITNNDSFRTAATAINWHTGTAENETLRTTENLKTGAEFEVTITAAGLSLIHGDLQVLTSAILLTTAIGAKRTSGLGQVQCEKLTIDGAKIEMSTLAGETIKHLQAEQCIA